MQILRSATNVSSRLVPFSWGIRRETMTKKQHETDMATANFSFTYHSHGTSGRTRLLDLLQAWLHVALVFVLPNYSLNLDLQHQPVYTLGKRGKKDDFLKSEEELRKLGVDIHTIARGGETTFHGPGQIIMYPIVNLRRLGIGARAYVEGLEDTIISTLQRHGISAQVSKNSHHEAKHGWFAFLPFFHSQLK